MPARTKSIKYRARLNSSAQHHGVSDITTVAAHLTKLLSNQDLQAGQQDLPSALRHVASSIGMRQVASQAPCTREGLYGILSDRGNPHLSLFLGILRAVGMAMKLVPDAATKISRTRFHKSTRKAG